MLSFQKKAFVRAWFVSSVLFLLFSATLFSQRKMETLDRGLVAVKTTNGVFVSWRIQGYEWYDTQYNIYCDNVKLNTTPLSVSNYLDASGTTTSSYTVSAVINGEEQPQCEAVTPWDKQYLEIPVVDRPDGYEINDATTADLDGDGQYEIIVKRIYKDWANESAPFSYFEAYQMDGTLMWEINVGPNILPDVEINIAAFDFDEDGKAEVFMRTSEGTIFGDGTQIGDTDGDGKTNYRSSVGTAANMQYMNEGPEFLSLINGETGAELDRVDFIPRGQSSDWGDSYGHRASKYFFGAPYLDGLKPSLFIGRGIYTKTIMRTYDVVNDKLVLKWEFNSGTSGSYFGQGNHNYTIADVDGDGRDEIVWGSMTVDDDGTGLYSTGLGHGDALHVGDLDPYRKGIEIFKCLENSPVWGTVLYDGATGEILIHHLTTYDCGRCCTANVSDDIKGAAVWGGSKMFSASTLEQVGTGSLAENFRIYWDGDLLEELVDHVGFSTTTGYGTGAVMKHGVGTIFKASGATSCNYTKGTPSLQADLLGDWREEIVWRREDNKAIRIYTTVEPTIYRNYSLMHDHQYRQAICWQMCGYNQPPHVSYFLGEAEGLTVPPPPVMSNNRLVYAGNGTWDNSSAIWNKNGDDVAFSDGEHVLFDVSAGSDVSVDILNTMAPEVLTVNSPGNYTLTASTGKLTGSMLLVKQGAGTLSLNGTHDFTGATDIWSGALSVNGELLNSAVTAQYHSVLSATGLLNNGVTLRYGSVLYVGGQNHPGTLTIGNQLHLEEGSAIELDWSAVEGDDADALVIDGDLFLDDNVNLNLNVELADGADRLEAGEYVVMTVSGSVTGDLSGLSVKGIENNLASLEFKDGQVVLVVQDTRDMASVIWDGALNQQAWDFGQTANFMNGAVSDVFLVGDEVLFEDGASSTTVNIIEDVRPSRIVVNSSENYIFSGEGMISGSTQLYKQGTGTLTIENDNDFTGKVTIEGGVLEVAKMPALNKIGSIGSVSEDASLLEINGGVLRPLGDMSAQRAVTIGENGGTLDVDGKVYWNSSFVGSWLTKTGFGQLIVSGINNHAGTIVREGTLVKLSDTSGPGARLILEGGTFQDNDNSFSYNTNSMSIEVPEGQSGTINLDSRCYYTGTLTGSGTLNVNIPFVRSDLNGNWSAFSGVINVKSTYSSGEAEMRFNNTNGLPNAMVNIGSSVNAYNINGKTIKFGALTGYGSLTGSHNYEIGAKNVDCEFAGVISGGSLTKVGTAVFTLSGSSTYSGSTIINEGVLSVNNASGSATGTGTVYAMSGATLTGPGSMTGSVYIESGGKLIPGSGNSSSKLTVTKSVVMKSGSELYVKLNGLFQSASRIVSSTSFVANGTLNIELTGGSYVSGASFKIIEAPSITGTFTAVEPAVPAEGLAWDLSELYSSGVLKITTATSVNEAGVNSSLTIYPNPASNICNIEVSNSDGVMQVFDANGRLIKVIDNAAGLSRIRLDVSNWPQGFYFIHYLVDGRLLVGKLIVE